MGRLEYTLRVTQLNLRSYANSASLHSQFTHMVAMRLLVCVALAALLHSECSVVSLLNACRAAPAAALHCNYTAADARGRGAGDRASGGGRRMTL